MNSNSQSVYNKQWKLRGSPPPHIIALLECSEFLATLLYQRLYNAEQPDHVEHFLEQVDHFLHDNYSNGLHDSLLMKGMPEASERIVRAIIRSEPMAVYGDFDTDGVTAVTLLMQVIPRLGGTIRPYIPHREREGYGLNMEAVDYLASEGVRLLITVDCGISNVDEVARANARGLDVIVTDHHQPPPVLPPALAVVNPKQPGCSYPYKQLVGVGIAFKLVQAVVKKLSARGKKFALRGRDMLDVVALGTVADMGPLLGENRVLVKAGLDALRTTERPGLLALMRAARVSQQDIDATAIGFVLGPRINAAGRLDDAVRAYHLLLSQDLAHAEALAQELNHANQQRQAITRRIMEESAALAESTGAAQQRIVVLDSVDYPSGVVGLVAGKLVERWARPVVLIARGEEISRGSARSIPTFNIFQALTSCKEAFAQEYPGESLFIRFGGHSMAAGFTIANSYLPELEQRLLALASEQLTDDRLHPTLYIDAEVALHDLTWDLYHQLRLLEPFGQANQQPVLLSRGLRITGIRPLGNEGKHLKLYLKQEATTAARRPLEAIAFGMGDQAERLRACPAVDIAYTLESNNWNDMQSLRLNVKDLRYI